MSKTCTTHFAGSIAVRRVMSVFFLVAALAVGTSCATRMRRCELKTLVIDELGRPLSGTIIVLKSDRAVYPRQHEYVIETDTSGIASLLYVQRWPETHEPISVTWSQSLTSDRIITDRNLPNIALCFKRATNAMVLDKVEILPIQSTIWVKR